MKKEVLNIFLTKKTLITIISIGLILFSFAPSVTSIWGPTQGSQIDNTGTVPYGWELIRSKVSPNNYYVIANYMNQDYDRLFFI